MNDLSPEQLRAEAEKLDRLVQRHARHGVVGPAREDHVPLPLTTRDTRTLTERDRHTPRQAVQEAVGDV